MCTLRSSNSMPIHCVSRNTFFQEASEELRAFYQIPESVVLYAVKDVDEIRPIACHKCGAHLCMVIHQYRVRYSQNLFGMIVYVIVVRFKCTACGTTITVIPSFTHCNHVYDAQAIGTCLDYRIATGHVLRKKDGVPVCPSWWLQQRWYKDFRYNIGFGNPSTEEMSRYMSHQRRQSILLHKNYVRMEAYPPTERNPSLHHGLRVVMPLLVK